MVGGIIQPTPQQADEMTVKAAPQDLENGALVTNNPTSIAISGQTVETHGPRTIRVGNVDVIRMM